MARRDTKLESEGAEFLVLGKLLVEGIPAFKTYTNFPGYDLIATNADKNSSARIQVKSSYYTDWTGPLVKNLDCDFVVYVLLNRGYRSGKKKKGFDGKKGPEFYVLPIEYILKVRNPKYKWGNIGRKRLVDLENYKDNWELVTKFLEQENF